MMAAVQTMLQSPVMISPAQAPMSSPTSTSTFTPTPALTPVAAGPTSQRMRDVAIDVWTSKIFDIINNGPSGGFVRYAISPRNELYVDKTGNRRKVEDVVSELLPQDSCRYIAYNFKFRRGSQIVKKVVWFVWTPESAPQREPVKYLDGLASTLIGLNCVSTIPILKGRSATDIGLEAIMAQV